MRPDDLIRLRHMLDAAREASGFVQRRSRSDLDGDRQLVWALVKAVEIIGEAAYQMSEASRGEVSNLPWEDIIGMRHRLIHGAAGEKSRQVLGGGLADQTGLLPRVQELCTQCT